MMYKCKPSKISIYINSGKKTIAQVKKETGCTAIMNGGVFNGNWTPGCWLKKDGKLLASESWKAWGFGWNEAGDVRIQLDAGGVSNFINCVALIRGGKALQGADLIYPADMGGSRQRTAWCLLGDGGHLLYCDKSGKTPEALRDYLLGQGVKDAIMLDGGGSSQCIFPDGKVNSSRIVQNFICFWADEGIKLGEDENSMFKIALGAGHGLNTPGKRCMKSLDKNETREWWLNDRICDKVESLLKSYTGYDLLRLDDSDDGEVNVELSTRVKNANDWGADIYISVHHNAGINGGSGGGIVAFSYPGSTEGAQWRDALYDALIAKTGLKGNRATPKTTANFYVLKHTSMPSVLLELGFMDSKTDVPIILTEKFADQCAAAIAEVLAARGKLSKKKAETTEDDGTLYKVQLGAFGNKENADKLAAQLEAKGYSAYVVKS